MAIIGKVKQRIKEAVGGKKTYQAKIKAAAEKEGHDLSGLTKKAKARRAAEKAAPVRKGSRQYRGASGSDLKEIEKKFGKKK
jgi:hypothetical protein